jgi:hypothetical protein
MAARVVRWSGSPPSSPSLAPAAHGQMCRQNGLSRGPPPRTTAPSPNKLPRVGPMRPASPSPGGVTTATLLHRDYTVNTRSTFHLRVSPRPPLAARPPTGVSSDCCKTLRGGPSGIGGLSLPPCSSCAGARRTPRSPASSPGTAGASSPPWNRTSWRTRCKRIQEVAAARELRRDPDGKEPSDEAKRPLRNIYLRPRPRRRPSREGSLRLKTGSRTERWRTRRAGGIRPADRSPGPGCCSR